ncbi:MAG: lipid-A-disaccharide synthase N-terminal domain-containing protein [Flammeovirgaceae bacterium]|nr:lipid-A-disaccharide synthase N-terminal domain-containing protein [Flammeovirgaceae bacterium]
MADSYWIYGLGFFAQSLFGARIIVQWFHTEKSGRVASPILFWQISLMASFLFLIYGILRNDAVIIFGQSLAYFIYIRNLQLKGVWNSFPKISRMVIPMMPLIALAYVFAGPSNTWQNILSGNDFTYPLVMLGAVGQLMLNFRFVYQWFHAEKVKESVFPIGFWVISAVASVFIVCYALYRIDPVLILASSMGLVAYVRNLIVALRPIPA